jgi:hypothetical protein
MAVVQDAGYGRQGYRSLHSFTLLIPPTLQPTSKTEICSLRAAHGIAKEKAEVSRDSYVFFNAHLL